MTKTEAISIIKGMGEFIYGDDHPQTRKAFDMAIEALSADAVQGWIPVKWHEITDEEGGLEGYPKEWVVHIDCDMPNDGDEILVQTKSGYIRLDVCYTDGEVYLDSGWDWKDDIVAWMPLPKPYEGSEGDE